MVYTFLLFFFCLIIWYLYYNHHYLLKIRKLKLTKCKWLLKLSQLVSGRADIKTQVISIFAPFFNVHYSTFYYYFSFIFHNHAFSLFLLFTISFHSCRMVCVTGTELGAKLPRFLTLALHLLSLLTLGKCNSNFLSLPFLFYRMGMTVVSTS